MSRIVAAAVLIVMSTASAYAIPGGSYVASCHSIHMEGPYVVALCGRGDGSLRWSRIFAPRCGGSGISNQWGHLTCGGYYR